MRQGFVERKLKARKAKILRKAEKHALTNAREWSISSCVAWDRRELSGSKHPFWTASQRPRKGRVVS